MLAKKALFQRISRSKQSPSQSVQRLLYCGNSSNLQLRCSWVNEQNRLDFKVKGQGHQPGEGIPIYSSPSKFHMLRVCLFSQTVLWPCCIYINVMLNFHRVLKKLLLYLFITCRFLIHSPVCTAGVIWYKLIKMSNSSLMWHTEFRQGPSFISQSP